MSAKPIIHQSIKRKRIACGADIKKVRSTPFCAVVTCKKCKAVVDRIVDAVFAPLK